MNNQVRIQVHLKDLEIHPLNPRKLVDGDKIKGLAQSIYAHGQQDDLKGARLANGKIGVLDGGRRLRALQMIEERSPGWADTHLIWVQVKEDAVEIDALVCNIQREGLSPFEEITAYKSCAGTMTLDDIAARFGVPKRHVKQRLKFAWLPDEILAALGEGLMSMDTLEVYATAKSAEAALAVFNRLGEHERHWAGAVRSALSETRIESNHPLVSLIDRAEYERRGGVVDENLFGENSLFQNPEIVQELVAERLAAEVNRVISEGWCWAEAVTTVGLRAEHTDGLMKVKGQPRVLTETEAARFAELDKVPHWELNSADKAEWRGLLTLKNSFTYNDEARAVSGVLLYVGHNGTVERREGLIRPEEAAEAKSKGLVAEDRVYGGISGAGGPAGKAPKEPGALSKKLKMDMRSIRVAAVQHEIAEDPDLAFDILVYSMAVGNAATEWSDIRSVTGIKLNEGSIWHGDVMDGRDGVVENPKVIDRRVLRDSFAMFRNRSRDEKMALMAAAVARSVRDPSFEDRRSATFDALGIAIGADIRRVWTPSIDGFLGDAPKARLFQIAEELGLETRALKTMKKQEVAQSLHDLFNDREKRAAYDPEIVAAADRWRPSDEDFCATQKTVAAESDDDEDEFLEDLDGVGGDVSVAAE